MKPKKDRAPFLVRLFDPKLWFMDFVRITGAIPCLVYLRLKRIFVTSTGKRKRGMFRGKFLVAANHSSFLDPAILTTAFWQRRVCFVATEDLFKLKHGKWFFGGIGCIPVNKENVSIETFKQVQEMFYRGHVVGIFPEGGVVRDDSMKAFKSGIALMAAMSGADIIPTYIVKRTNGWRRQVVFIGEKIKLRDHITSEFPTMDELEKLTQLLQDTERELERVAIERENNRRKK